MENQFTIKKSDKDGNLNDLSFNIPANESAMELVDGLTRTPVLSFKIMCEPISGDDGRLSSSVHEGQKWFKTRVLTGPAMRPLDGDYYFNLGSTGGGGKRKKSKRLKSKKRKSHKRRSKRRS